jgi:hypothetical protein
MDARNHLWREKKGEGAKVLNLIDTSPSRLNFHGG